MKAASLIIALLLAQNSATQTKATITGYVVRMGGGDPVSKARVVLTRNGVRGSAYSATTEGNGRFVFQNLEAGEYRLEVTRNGYVRTEYGQRSPNRPGLPITVGPGQQLTDVVFQLIPAGTIAGRIYDRDGEPLPNVMVQAMRYVYRQGERTLTPVQQAATNDLGEYRLFWLDPGQYYVSATYADGQGPGRFGPAAFLQRGRGGPGQGTPIENASGEDEGYVPIYFPNTFDPVTASPINLPAGVTYTGVDLSVSPVRTLRIRGIVMNAATGQPAPAASVVLIPRRTGAMGIGMNRARAQISQGRFELRGVVPGSYDVVATLTDRTNRMTGRVAVDVGGADVDNVTLVLSPGFPVSGRLAIEGKPPSSNDPELSRIRVNIRSDSGPQGPFGGGPLPSAEVQPNGTFVVSQVTPGDYRLTISGMPARSYVKMARLGSIDVLDRGLQINEQPNALLEVLVSPNTATIDGSVTDDKQNASVNVTVALVPDAPRRERMDLYRVASTDATGRFHFEGVPPGDYRLFAWEDVETGAWQDPEFIRLYEPRGKPVRLGENAQTTADLKIIPPQM